MSPNVERLNLTGWDPKRQQEEFMVEERARAEEGLAGAVRWIPGPSVSREKD